MKATKYLSLAALALMGTLASCQSDDEAAAAEAQQQIGAALQGGEQVEAPPAPAGALSGGAV